MAEEKVAWLAEKATLQSANQTCNGDLTALRARIPAIVHETHHSNVEAYTRLFLNFAAHQWSNDAGIQDRWQTRISAATNDEIEIVQLRMEVVDLKFKMRIRIRHVSDSTADISTHRVTVADLIKNLMGFNDDTEVTVSNRLIRQLQGGTPSDEILIEKPVVMIEKAQAEKMGLVVDETSGNVTPASIQKVEEDVAIVNDTDKLKEKCNDTPNACPECDACPGVNVATTSAQTGGTTANGESNAVIANGTNTGGTNNSGSGNNNSGTNNDSSNNANCPGTENSDSASSSGGVGEIIWISIIAVLVLLLMITFVLLFSQHKQNKRQKTDLLVLSEKYVTLEKKKNRAGGRIEEEKLEI